MSRKKGFVFKLGRQSIFLVVLLAALLMTACSRHEAVPHQRIPEVAVFVVQPEKVVLTTVLPGRTSAFRVSEIRPQVSGYILKRLFKEGSDVKAGQVLYQIDPAPFQAALDNAKAALAKAKANLPAIQLRAKRYKELLADKAISQQDYDDAVAALGQVRAEIEYWKAQVKSAQINLGYTKVTAPISGRIGRSNVTEGAVVTAYQPTPLATIHQLDPIYVDVPQSTAELLRLKKRLQNGSLYHDGENYIKVKLILEDGSLYPYEGTFQFRDVSVDPTTGSVILRMIFPNPEKILLPNMFVRAVIREGVKEDAILVPQQAVMRTLKGEPYVLVVGTGDKVEMRMLQLDRTIDNKWLVVSGITAGDRVIIEGLQFVRPGMKVKVSLWNENNPSEERRSKNGAVKQDMNSKGGA